MNLLTERKGAKVNRSDVLNILGQCRLVAIVRLDDLRSASDLVAALLRGGIRAIEFTLTNPNAPRVVSNLLEQFEQFHDGSAVLGIGSVRSVLQARLALDAGSQFLVAPVSDPSVIQTSVQADVPIMPGAFTPTEIAQATSWGADIVKVFPARNLGPNFIRDILAPMPELKLMPTGGVDFSNIRDYLTAGAVAVGVGGQLIDAQSVREAKWSEIESAARTFVSYTNAVN